MAPSSREFSYYKDKANKAYKETRWKDAVDAYTKALSAEESHILFANRSAAHLKLGNIDEALQDANKAISMEPQYSKGYGRKGAAYHCKSDYARALTAYKDGLKICPNDEQLKLGLAAAKRARIENSKANQAARMTKSTRSASARFSFRAKKATTVSSFVEKTRSELMLQKTAIEAQLDLIDELSAMSSEDKSDLLFNLIDTDKNGLVDALELAHALRKRSDELSLGESIERAIQVVSQFDTDGDAKLDPDEFGSFLHKFTGQMGLDFNDFCEFLAFQLLFRKDDDANALESTGMTKEEIEAKIKEQSDLIEVYESDRLVDLFKLFDKDGTREVYFFDASAGLLSLRRDVESRRGRRALDILLMLDRKERRMLNFEQFARLIMAVTSTVGQPFDDVVDDLTLLVTSNKIAKQKDLDKLVVPREYYTEVAQIQKGGRPGAEKLTGLTYCRLQKLFDLWDQDGDGSISPMELKRGLATFKVAAEVDDDVHKTVSALMEFDEDGNKNLDRIEFAFAMLFYADAFGVDIHDLIDFMVVSAVLKHDDLKCGVFQAAFRQNMKSKRVVHPAHMDYFDAPEDDWDPFADNDPFSDFPAGK